MWKDFMRKVSYKAEIQALKEENKRLKEDLRHESVMIKYWSRKAFFWKEKAQALEWNRDLEDSDGEVVSDGRKADGQAEKENRC